MERPFLGSLSELALLYSGRKRPLKSSRPSRPASPILTLPKVRLVEVGWAESSEEFELTSFSFPPPSCTQVYANEETVGKAIKDSGVSREQLFITSKSNQADPRKSCEASLRKVSREMGRDRDLELTSLFPSFHSSGLPTSVSLEGKFVSIRTYQSS